MSTKGDKNSLIEGEDFTIEDGLYVFTRKYHLKRGYCCESGCRNCPYRFRKDKDEGRNPGAGDHRDTD